MLITLALAPLAHASTISYAPATISVTEGQAFSVNVSVDPVAEKAYGVQLEAIFPADLVEATGMTLESGWISPASPSIAAGKLTQMAGIGGGFAAKKILGTIVFRAKKSGTATIAVAGSSIVSNAQGANTLVGLQGASVVTITAAPAPEPAPAPKPAPQAPAQTTGNTVVEPAETATASVNEGAANQAPVASETVPEENAQLAAVALADVGGFSTTSMILIGLALLAIIGGGIWFWRRERSQF
ncbi:MAG: pyruvate dehydrogenase E2 component [Parcubacteria group bacterium GW2011_GWA2_56_21]|nr:MAG: pyruvate dehydrogenase E2 component [Parcubacteria group bacterium GW2011_GWA2_56_21]